MQTETRDRATLNRKTLNELIEDVLQTRGQQQIPQGFSFRLTWTIAGLFLCPVPELYVGHLDNAIAARGLSVERTTYSASIISIPPIYVARSRIHGARNEHRHLISPCFDCGLRFISPSNSSAPIFVGIDGRSVHEPEYDLRGYELEKRCDSSQSRNMMSPKGGELSSSCVMIIIAIITIVEDRGHLLSIRRYPFLVYVCCARRNAYSV